MLINTFINMTEGAALNDSVTGKMKYAVTLSLWGDNS